MPDDLIPLRARFWPRYVRWSVAFQLVPALLFGLNALFKIAHGDWQPDTAFFVSWGIVSAVLAVVALFVAFRRRNLGCAEITPLGLRPYTIRHGWDIRYRWAEIETVWVKAGPFGNRWLEVVPDNTPPFKLTASPTNPADVLDALERFAGPDHPLTRAYFTLLDG